MTKQKKKREKFDEKKSAAPIDVLAEEFGNEYAEATFSKEVNASEHAARKQFDKQ
ncbi:hypothetical protein [Calidifontibacillus erzurumensis]|uniref:Uncharacterized protein n=1 Tax=Calidifontibacillus erzurumensis TaxID=2741433 RepID=A0A8J8GEM3_9BACI|nr:hypothetical protein [Calidifontibacillus erzurumensis]NSL52247.1 hypothetical protein [Calidifontibacillus erzurumensis]